MVRTAGVRTAGGDCPPKIGIPGRGGGAGALTGVYMLVGEAGSQVVIGRWVAGGRCIGGSMPGKGGPPCTGWPPGMNQQTVIGL